MQVHKKTGDSKLKLKGQQLNTNRINLSTITNHPNHILKRNRRIFRHTIPSLPSPHMHIIQTMKIMILHMPSKPTKQHTNIHHRRRHPGYLLLHKPQQRPFRPRYPSHIPLCLPHTHPPIP
ncbi:hypothetical protein Hanom_Chr07g00592841 [Helianthus anomalus]